MESDCNDGCGSEVYSAPSIFFCLAMNSTTRWSLTECQLGQKFRLRDFSRGN